MPSDDDIPSAATLPSGIALSRPTPVPDSLAAPSLLADRYRLRGLLGAGGMGRVYLAHDRTLDELVALKLLRREILDLPGMLERFHQEVKLARRVTNEHVVRTFDLGRHENDHFLTMEYIDGRSLAQRLDDGALAIDEAVPIARAACVGIAAAHAAGVLHRDLKPDNVLLARTGRVAITDFGIARTAADPSARSEGLVGTPAYMAPEQVEGADTIGPAVDVYAFGAILFEMLTGRRPFVGDNALDVAFARLREPPPDPRSLRPLPDEVAELVLRCLARAPTARFVDGADLLRAFDALAEVRAATPIPMRPAVMPASTAQAVALLPLRASADLAEVAEGLTEEIADVLTMTRALRVRPLSSVRRAMHADADSREIGAALSVDIVVDGSVRRRGDGIRIAARAISVADGFQVWASHVDTVSDGLLAAGDEVAREIARALTVEIDVPKRATYDARVGELYLAAKASVRVRWFGGEFGAAIGQLEHALELAPDHAGALSTLAMALARCAFYGQPTLPRARTLAARAIALAPTSGEAWLALGIERYTANLIPDAARALRRSLERAPGNVQAQELLGGIVLEAGGLEDGIAHLEAARALDPTGPKSADLPRAYGYQGRYELAERLLAHVDVPLNGQLGIARLRMWRGQRYEFTPAPSPDIGEEFMAHAMRVAELHRTGELPEATRRWYIDRAARTANPRLRCSRLQHIVEILLHVGDRETAMTCLETCVDAGLYDLLWIERCPMLAPVRDVPRFRELAEIVRQRANTIIDAVTSERSLWAEPLG